MAGRPLSLEAGDANTATSIATKTPVPINNTVQSRAVRIWYYPCMCIGRSVDSGSMFWLKCVIAQIEPNTTRHTMSTPKASAITLLALSGSVVMCKKKIEWIPSGCAARHEHHSVRQAGRRLGRAQDRERQRQLSAEPQLRRRRAISARGAHGRDLPGEARLV